MQLIDLKEREVFGDQGCGVAVLTEGPQAEIRQIGLEPGREIPARCFDGAAVIQVLRGGGLFRAGAEGLRLAPGKLLQLPAGTTLEVVNDTAEPLVFLVIGPPPAEGAGSFYNFVEFAPVKPGKEEAFEAWFHRSSEILSAHPGFLSRRLLRSIEQGGGYASVIEHASKETFMDMQLSDDRERLFKLVEPLLLGASRPRFYETLEVLRKR